VICKNQSEMLKIYIKLKMIWKKLTMVIKIMFFRLKDNKCLGNYLVILQSNGIIIFLIDEKAYSRAISFQFIPGCFRYSFLFQSRITPLPSISLLSSQNFKMWSSILIFILDLLIIEFLLDIPWWSYPAGITNEGIKPFKVPTLDIEIKSSRLKIL